MAIYNKLGYKCKRTTLLNLLSCLYFMVWDIFLNVVLIIDWLIVYCLQRGSPRQCPGRRVEDDLLGVPRRRRSCRLRKGTSLCSYISSAPGLFLKIIYLSNVCPDFLRTLFSFSFHIFFLFYPFFSFSPLFTFLLKAFYRRILPLPGIYLPTSLKGWIPPCYLVNFFPLIRYISCNAEFFFLFSADFFPF